MENENKGLTGYFSDGVRRIDIVLVLEDVKRYEERFDKIKIDFFINIIKIGLEIELEEAVMKQHERLIFVKVHAPDDVIEEYGSYYKIRKYFKDTHIEFINPHPSLLGIKTEKELIKTIRLYYPGPLHYSNIERSSVVYHMLLSLPFGEASNYVGLQRLIERNIILDAYALHDGPYFFPENQMQNKINGRQVLLYNWVGIRNVFKMQPLHLIREYLGEKVAFYFAFYEYLNIALVYATVLGIFVIVKGFHDIYDDVAIKEACTENKTDVNSIKIVCPLCRDFNVCPFRNLSEFCPKVMITNFIDNPWTMIYCISICLWAISFVLLWCRNKNYLSWLWEYDQSDTKQAIRSNFETDVKNMRISKLTGIITDTDRLKTRVFRLFVTLFTLFVWVLLNLMLTLSLIVYKYELSAEFNKISKTWRDYLAVITITCVYVLLVSLLDKVSCLFTYQLTHFENHKTNNSFESSFATKLFCFSSVCNFLFLASFYFVNALYTYPSDKNRWYLIGGIGMMNCGPEGCLDELCVALVVTILIREYVMKLPFWFLKTKTDYTQTNYKLPCWEREYLLSPLTEYELIRKFNQLVMKFTLLGLFGTAFPLAPLLILISGICDIRYESRQILLVSRRPLLCQPTSQRVWYKIMLAVVYAVPCFNTIALTSMTTMLHYTRTDYQSTYFMFSMGTFNTEDYNKITGPGSPEEAVNKYKGLVPIECLFPGLRFRSRKRDGEYYAVERFWRIKFDKHILMLEVEHLALLLMVTLHCLIPASPRDITDTVAIEEIIKQKARYNKIN